MGDVCGLGVTVGDVCGLGVTVGGWAVLNEPPIWVVKLVGSGVGVWAAWVGVGEDMGVALSNARTVAWTRATMVASISGPPAYGGLGVWVSAAMAWTVAATSWGNGV